MTRLQRCHFTANAVENDCATCYFCGNTKMNYKKVFEDFFKQISIKVKAKHTYKRYAEL